MSSIVRLLRLDHSPRENGCVLRAVAGDDRAVFPPHLSGFRRAVVPHDGAHHLIALSVSIGELLGLECLAELSLAGDHRASVDSLAVISEEAPDRCFIEPVSPGGRAQHASPASPFVFEFGSLEIERLVPVAKVTLDIEFPAATILFRGPLERGDYARRSAFYAGPEGRVGDGSEMFALPHVIDDDKGCTGALCQIVEPPEYLAHLFVIQRVAARKKSIERVEYDELCARLLDEAP